MPFLAAFTAAEAAVAAEAAIAAEAALAAEAAAAAGTAAAGTTAAAAAPTVAAPTVGAGTAGAGITAAELANLQALTGGAGTQVAALGPGAGLDALAATGGPGAGGAGVQTAMQNATQAAASPGPAITTAQGITAAPQPAGGISNLASPVTAPGPGPIQYQLGQPGGSGGTAQSLKLGTQASSLQATPSATNAMYQTPGPSAFDKFSTFADKHPFMTGATMYLGATQLGLFDQKGAEMPQRRPYGGPQYRLSPDFRPMDPDANVYEPRYETYAEGGITGYAKGGSLSESLDFYKQMAEGRASKGATAPKADADVGIYYDLDPDTRYQDALTAAQIRQAKLNKRSNVRMPSTGIMRRPTPMGQINLAPPGVKEEKEAAQGGIMEAGYAMGGPVADMSAANIYDMQNARGGVSDMGIDNSTGMQRMASGGISSLGGYAAGGNPRLLKGPGDGMSDNIPAVIGRKQPARLADGEFVIPADVVSHLGNGSTEAGAKRLHEMMNRVRKARTGNPKQGKRINPNKFMPK